MSHLTNIAECVELGTYEFQNRITFDIARTRLGDMDCLSLSLDTGFDQIVRDEINDRGIDLNNPVLIFHAEANDPHKTTEAYYATEDPMLFLRIFTGGQYDKNQLTKILKNKDLSNANKSGIIVELEAIGPQLANIFQQIITSST